MGRLRRLRAIMGVAFSLSVALFALTPATVALAHAPLRDASALKGPVREAVAVQVKTARVILADYGLIRRDFAETRGMSDAQIDEWLLSKTGYISLKQTKQATVNTAIEVGEKRIRALRPKDYGRALVYRTGNGGMIDGKGAGGENPGAGDHADGLATLGESIREFLYEKLARTLFLHSGSRFDTVESYAVIDWGFEVIHEDGKKDPAGMVLRQAHSRARGRYSLFRDADAREVEVTLRKYGVTTAGAYRDGAEAEAINVQGTPDGAIVDFGGFLTVQDFDRPARNFYGNDFILNVGDLDFVQPDARTRVPFETWGYTVTGIEDPKFDNPWVWSHELARNLRDGIADRPSVQRHFENLVGSYRRALFGAGGEATPGAMETLVRAIEEVH